MPPNGQTVIYTNTINQNHEEKVIKRQQIIWPRVIILMYLNYGLFLGFFQLITTAKIATLFWVDFLSVAAGLGVTAGVHRLWAHRSYKAKLPLKILLMLFQTLSSQKDIYSWVRDHRLHHKYSDTEYDPHNAKRGFFYSHMGWIMLTKSDHTLQKGKTLDLKDLEADPVVMFQRKYYWYLNALVSVVIPMVVPWYFWNESLHVIWNSCVLFRICLVLHCSWFVNSAAHIFGNKPYDKAVEPKENWFVTIISQGEGFHNYHHTFPWDYKASELGTYYGNFTTCFLDWMAKIGWAFDLKSVDKNLVKRIVKGKGDGSWREENHNTYNKALYFIRVFCASKPSSLTFLTLKLAYLLFTLQ